MENQGERVGTKEGEWWDQSVEMARFPKSCTRVLQAESPWACLPALPRPLLWRSLKLSLPWGGGA